MSDLSKKFAFVFFLVFPFVGGYVPEFKFAGLTYNGERIFMYGFGAMVIYEWVRHRFKLKISSISIWYFIYSFFSFMNRTIQAGLNKPEIINFALPILFLIFIDNVRFKPKDLKVFTKILMVVGVATFLGSLIQLTINPYFYAGIDSATIDEINHYQMGSDNLFRNNSIFRGIGNNEGGIAFAYLGVFFLFMNFYKYRLLYLVLNGLLVFSVFVIFAKYVWISYLIGILFFVFHRYPNSRQYLFTLSLMVLFFIYFFAFDMIEQTTVYQSRVNVTTHEGRIESTMLFLERFFLYKPVFGYGIGSWFYGPYMALSPIGIHIGHFEVLFKGGLVGLTLFWILLFQIYRRAKAIKNVTGNPIFIAYLCIFIFINFTAVFLQVNFYGYYVMFFYMGMYYNIYVERQKTVRPPPTETRSKSMQLQTSNI